MISWLQPVLVALMGAAAAAYLWRRACATLRALADSHGPRPAEADEPASRRGCAGCAGCGTASRGCTPRG